VGTPHSPSLPPREWTETYPQGPVEHAVCKRKTGGASGFRTMHKVGLSFSINLSIYLYVMTYLFTE